MNGQFTPGPWSVGRLQKSSNFAKDTYCVQVGATVLCKVKGGVTEDAEIALANARLIAAAPELLLATRFLLDALEVDSTENFRSRARSEALAIVAKATGEQA